MAKTVYWTTNPDILRLRLPSSCQTAHILKHLTLIFKFTDRHRLIIYGASNVDRY